jgi:hypothetical protein
MPVAARAFQINKTPLGFGDKTLATLGSRRAVAGNHEPGSKWLEKIWPA